MEKEFYLTLQDVGDLIYRCTQNFLFRNNKDLGVDIGVQASQLQETFILRLPDYSHILVKIFPHKNFFQEFVYRIEIYKTSEGEMRGRKIAFYEASKHDSSVTEIQKFIQSYLSQLGF